MLKKAALCAVAGLMCMVGTSADASSTGMGYVTQIIVQHEGVVFFQTDAMASTAWPSCAVTQRYAINLADPGGPSLYSAVLTAQKAHSQISISGKGTCDIWADSESVEYVAVNP